MSHTKTAQIKLLNRVKRIRGQMDSVERALASEGHDCADVLMLLAAARGGINGLMAEVLEDHIRLHLLKDGHSSYPRAWRRPDRSGLRLSQIVLLPVSTQT